MVLFLIGGVDSSIKCGVMDYTNRLRTALKSLDIHVVSIEKNGPLENSLEISNWHSIKAYYSLAKEISKTIESIVQIEYPAKAYGKSIGINLFPLFCRLYGVKVVFTSHEYSNRSFLGRIRQWPSFIAADKVVVVEPRFEDDLIRFSFFKKKISTICIGSNIAKSESTEERIKEIRKSIANPEEKIMSYFGFVNEFKCFKEIIEALKILTKKGESNLKFLIIGELSKDDVYQAEILQMIEGYGLQNNIVITGYLKDEVADYLRASDFCILPFVYGISVRNGSFLAAYQEGIDIITSKPQGRFPYKDISFLEDNTPETMVKAINEMINKSSNKKNRKIDFDWKSIAKKHKELYYSLAD